MDKLKLAHEYAMQHLKNSGGKITMHSLCSFAWQYADAMQAEAEEREDKARPEVLLTKDKDGKCLHFHHEFGHKKCMDCGESLCEVDWRVAPQDTTGWKIKEGRAYWIDSDGWIIEDAPSFGFTGSHIVERPNGF